ncbi:non-canonical purine NTP pyrophosphatase [Rhodopila sp.]|uniref:non-canonical purine NTP pyrophosphatase n=1 Tax=Rhodopila sp. TaxID=2480087 RepID=UPI003D11A52B
MVRTLCRGQQLVLATHNPGKLQEFEALLGPVGIDLVSAAALGLHEPEEDAADFAGNARIKAVAAATASGLVALSDDSGFCVAGLGGAPGVHSARWAGESKDFAAAMERVHQRLGDSADRRAWFVAALCLAWPDGRTATFLGRIDGAVAWPPRGGNGFGYDPMFQPGGAQATFGEMDPDAKHAVSHRARAFVQVLACCLG